MSGDGTTTECSLPSNVENIEYTIYYKDPCDSNSYISTGKKVTVRAIIDFLLDDDTKCTLTGITSVKVVSNVEIDTGDSYYLELQDEQNNRYPFNDCTKGEDKKTFTCSQTEQDKTNAELTEKGTYSITNFAINLGDGTVDQVTIKSESVKYVEAKAELSDLGDKQTQTITILEPYFYVPVVDNTVGAEIYIGSAEEASPLTCTAVQGNINLIKCETDDNSLPVQEDGYEIWYQPSCGEKANTGIKVKKIDAIPIDTMVISDNSVCSKSVFTTIKIIMKNDMTVASDFKATLQDKNSDTMYPFSDCTYVDSKTITCSQSEGTDSPTLDQYGIYILSSLEGTGTNTEVYTVAQMTKNQIEYAQDTTTVVSNSGEIELNQSTKEFTVNLGDEFNPLPIILLGEVEQLLAKCERDTTDLTKAHCKISDKQLGIDANLREVCYIPACGTIQKTSLSVRKSAYTNDQVSLSHISFKKDSTITCTKTATNLYITSDIVAPGEITLTLTGTEEKQFPCSNGGTTTITCDLTGIALGTYTVQSLDTTDDYTTLDSSSLTSTIGYTDNESIEIAADLGDKASQVITTDDPVFYVPVTDNTKEAKIYIGDNENTLTCSPVEGSTTMLKCETDKSVRIEPYEIWYETPCRTKEDTSIRVTKAFRADKLYLGYDGSSTCTTEFEYINIRFLTNVYGGSY